MSAAKKLLIVAHVPSANMRALARAALRGARNPEVSGVESELISPFAAGPDDVVKCDAILLGTSENFGYMSGALKDFFDRIYYPCLDQTQALPFAAYVRAGLDGTGTITAIGKITSGLKWKPVQETLLCHGQYRDEFVDQVEALGLSMAAGLDAGIF